VEKISPHALLDEIYPLAAYYDETWKEKIESICISGAGSRFPEFLGPIEAEFKCEVRPLLREIPSGNRLAGDVRPLVEAGLDGMVGWIMSRD